MTRQSKLPNNGMQPTEILPFSLVLRSMINAGRFPAADSKHSASHEVNEWVP